MPEEPALEQLQWHLDRLRRLLPDLVRFDGSLDVAVAEELCEEVEFEEGDEVVVPEGRILRAWYGAREDAWREKTQKGADVSAKVRSLASYCRSFRVSNVLLGDPAPYCTKTFFLQVRVSTEDDADGLDLAQ
jgi:hypothetical protein